MATDVDAVAAQHDGCGRRRGGAHGDLDLHGLADASEARDVDPRDRGVVRPSGHDRVHVDGYIALSQGAGLLEHVAGRDPPVADDDDAALGVARQDSVAEAQRSGDVGRAVVDHDGSPVELRRRLQHAVESGVAAEGDDRGQVAFRPPIERLPDPFERGAVAGRSHRGRRVDQEHRRHTVAAAAQERGEQRRDHQRRDGEAHHGREAPLEPADADGSPSQPRLQQQQGHERPHEPGQQRMLLAGRGRGRGLRSPPER